MGISKKIEEEIDQKNLSKTIPIIRRFSGGGTVFVDPNTLFVTFIFSKKGLSFSTPETILNWAKNLLSPIFPPSFDLRENDFVLNNIQRAAK